MRATQQQRLSGRDRARRAFPLPMQFLIFAAVGMGNALVDAGVFAALVRMWDPRSGIEAVVASTAGFLAGAVHSYLWNSRVTFRGRETGPHRVPRFVLVVAVAAAVSAVAFAGVSAGWAHEATRLPAAKATAIAVGAVVNFALLRRWAFPRIHPSALARGGRVGMHPIATILGMATVVRLPFLLYPGYPWDIRLFSLWAQTASQVGLAEAMRRPDMDYVGYNYVLVVAGWLFTAATGVTDLAGSTLFGLLLKVVPTAGDLLIVALLFLAVSSWQIASPRWLGRLPWLGRLDTQHRSAAAAALLYALNPGTLYDSAYWGQIDSVVAAAMLGALLLAASGRPGWAGAVMALGFLVKPHPVIVAPVLFWTAFWGTGLLGVARGVAAASAVLAAGLFPFWLLGVGDQVREIYRHLFQVGDQISVSAWNGWWIAFRAKADTFPSDPLLTVGTVSLSYSETSKALLGLAVGVAAFSVGPRPAPGRVLLAGAFLACSFFMLTMKMHERYLFPLLALLAPAAVLMGRAWLGLYLALSATFLLNLVSIYPFPPPAPPVARHYLLPPLDVAVSAVNVVLSLVFGGLLLHSGMAAWSGLRWPSARTLLLGAPRRRETARIGPNLPYREGEAALYSPANPKGKGWS